MPSAEEQLVVSTLLYPLRSPCVLELGAHTGEDESWIRAAFQEPCHYVMVEPDPRNCQSILDRHFARSLVVHRGFGERRLGSFSIFQYAQDLGSRRLVIGAIADENGFREFNFSFNADNCSRTSGSLRKPTGHLQFFPEIKFPYRGMVPTFTLDTIFEKEWLTKIDLLWADIQGAENMMIAGGQTALKHTRYLFMEIEKTELYEGEALGHELIGMLPGWKVIRQFDFNVLMENLAFEERGPR